ncbi:DUF779 domain-containing protein [Chitinophaga sp.]|uniref:DUF779 domain-containing protein n=1 Tax=Chitinophaga sp. TaxID=1869181 RepID=UPI0026233FFA|nr:DUF779 domain-containing protein [uncultured Chitinophaga sp.]
MNDSRIVAAKPAMQLIRQLVSRHGPLEFRISGSCVEGFTPTCVHGNAAETVEDRYSLGTVAGCPAYIEPAPGIADDYSHFVLQVEEGRTNPGSLEAPGNVRFFLTKKISPREIGARAGETNPHMFSYLFGYSGNWG